MWVTRTFSLFPHFFHPFKGKLTLYQTIPNFNDTEKEEKPFENIVGKGVNVGNINEPKKEKKPFENIVGKGENAGNQHYLLFPQCFLPVPKTNFNFSVTLELSSANAFNFQ